MVAMGPCNSKGALVARGPCNSEGALVASGPCNSEGAFSSKGGPYYVWFIDIVIIHKDSLFHHFPERFFF